jgi:hypothetical protein
VVLILKNKEAKGSFCKSSVITSFQQALHCSLKTINFQGEEKTFDAMLDQLAETIIWYTILI